MSKLRQHTYRHTEHSGYTEKNLHVTQDNLIRTFLIIIILIRY